MAAKPRARNTSLGYREGSDSSGCSAASSRSSSAAALRAVVSCQPWCSPARSCRPRGAGAAEPTPAASRRPRCSWARSCRPPAGTLVGPGAGALLPVGWRGPDAGGRGLDAGGRGLDAGGRGPDAGGRGPEGDVPRRCPAPAGTVPGGLGYGRSTCRRAPAGFLDAVSWVGEAYPGSPELLRPTLPLAEGPGPEPPGLLRGRPGLPGAGGAGAPARQAGSGGGAGGRCGGAGTAPG